MDARSARKHESILEAATSVFLSKGYAGTSMDDIAKLAAVSKQTVYKHFADKPSLFTEIIHTGLDRTDDLADRVTGPLADSEDVDRDLTTIARRFAAVLTEPRLLALRRLVIAEADRFPELGRAYYERGPERIHALMAESLLRLRERGVLTRLDDPLLAAHHFTSMISTPPQSRVMFCGPGVEFTRAELDGYADAAVRVFLAAYR
ncbi:TetR/AcrR family transcriptional regulator [Streptomyces sp. NPDC051921]|uniref:TetR/AcrR family transcriptional regulator n=1 Tax=Streptomyces sp. NPDC051921 TaxID=3155806 RepID=UPI00344ADD94